MGSMYIIENNFFFFFKKKNIDCQTLLIFFPVNKKIKQECIDICYEIIECKSTEYVNFNK
jgi:hypothetical protein